MRLNRQGDKTCYSETRCSFARHFAILSRNVGILIGSLLRAKLRAQISTCCLVVFVCSGGSKSGMFQVLLQYFEDRYASFYVQNPITDFTELLERVKKAVPVLKGIPHDQIRISYKDVQLGTFLNIDSHEQLHLQETFRNAFPCGSDSYRRVHLKVRESDSPFLLKSSRSSQPLPQETEHTKPSVAKSKLEPKTLFTPSDDGHESELASTFNWKNSKKEQSIWQQQSLCDKKLAIETHLREPELQVVEPRRARSYNSICGNCHIRGHRNDGNKKNDKCNAPPCTSYFIYGQKKKHSEHFEEIKKRKRELKKVTREIEKVNMEKKT